MGGGLDFLLSQDVSWLAWWGDGKTMVVASGRKNQEGEGRKKKENKRRRGLERTEKKQREWREERHWTKA